MSYYQTRIAEIVEQRGAKVDPLHVEAWMRSDLGSLDALSRVNFLDAVMNGIDCATDAAPGLNEKLARSYGLTRRPLQG